MDELRSEIWDYLFRAGEPVSVNDIAQSFGRDEETIRDVVNHSWFVVSDHTVTVAFQATSRGRSVPER